MQRKQGSSPSLHKKVQGTRSARHIEERRTDKRDTKEQDMPTWDGRHAQKEGRMRCGGATCIGRKARSKSESRSGKMEEDVVDVVDVVHGMEWSWMSWSWCKPAGRIATGADREAGDSDGMVMVTEGRIMEEEKQVDTGYKREVEGELTEVEDGLWMMDDDRRKTDGEAE